MADERYHLPASDIKKLKRSTISHFLNKRAQRRSCDLGELVGLTSLGVTLVEVEPGREMTEYHLHYHQDEVIYILEGEGTSFVGPNTFEVGPGDLLGYRKGGLAHTLENTGSRPLKCLIVSELGKNGVTDYPRLGKRVFRNNGLRWNLVDQNDIKLPVVPRPVDASREKQR